MKCTFILQSKVRNVVSIRFFFRFGFDVCRNANVRFNFDTLKTFPHSSASDWWRLCQKLHFLFFFIFSQCKWLTEKKCQSRSILRGKVCRNQNAEEKRERKREREMDKKRKKSLHAHFSFARHNSPSPVIQSQFAGWRFWVVHVV